MAVLSGVRRPRENLFKGRRRNNVHMVSYIVSWVKDIDKIIKIIGCKDKFKDLHPHS